MSKKDQEHWTKVFDECMQRLSGVYNREFTHATIRAYFEGCEGWSETRMREAFKKAIESEKFCPTVATIRAYGSSVREQSEHVVMPSTEAPTYTPEQRAELDQWKREFAASFVPPPWMRDGRDARYRRRTP